MEPVSSATALARLVDRFRDDQHGARSFLGAAARFVVTGSLSVAADVGLLAILRSALGWPLALATVLAYTAGLLVNYSLNRNWTFRSSRNHRQTLVRYAVMVGFNAGATLGIVVGLSSLGLFYLLAKLIAVAINASVNFLAGRHWVFGS